MAFEIWPHARPGDLPGQNAQKRDSVAHGFGFVIDNSLAYLRVDGLVVLGSPGSQPTLGLKRTGVA